MYPVLFPGTRRVSRFNAEFFRAAKSSLLIALAFGLSFTARAQTVAFPGALGFGAYATGGRNGTVFHVTTLTDTYPTVTPGSFRDAVAHSGRTVVFDVGGTINLVAAVSCAGNLTIAGQTAPGGICFNGGEMGFSDRANIICRYIRIRPGSDTSSTGDDCVGFSQTTNCILDHMSMEFGPWNNIDAVTANNITVQHCIDANPTGQQFGAHTENVGASYAWQYNILANSHNRNPLAKINTVFINNLEYNNSAGYTTHTSTRFKHDIVNNYFIAGPASGGNFPWYQIDKNQSIYYSGNLYDGDKNGTLNGSTTTPYWYQGVGTVLTAPWSSWTTVIPTMSPDLAERYDLSTAGAFPRDDVDSLVLSQIKTLGSGTTGTGVGTTGPDGGLYTSQAQTGLSNNGYGTLTGLTAPTDTDGDGMPDYWEQANGLNPNVANPLTNTITGYTPLENYLNFLAAPHAVTQTNTPVDLNLRQFTTGFAASATFSLTNATNGTVSLLSGTNAHFIPAANFTGLAGFNFTVTEGSYSLSAAVTICVTTSTPPAAAIAFNGALITAATNSIASGPISLPANLLWRGDGSVNAWNTTTSNWLNGASAAAFKNGDVVTFDDTGSNTPAISIPATLSPGTTIFNDDKNYTLSGNGSLTGSGTLNKTGAGTLTVGTTNSSFTGAISINGGQLALVSGASLGSGPISLADGGILNVLGGGGGSTVNGSVTIPAGDNVTITSGQLATTFGGAIISPDTTTVLNVSNGVSFSGTGSGQFSGFLGTINIQPGATLRFSANSSGTSFGSLNPSFIVNGTLQPRDAGNTVNVGSMSGSGQLRGQQTQPPGGLTGAITYNIGGNNTDSTFTGTIIDSNPTNLTGLVKSGTGKLTLTGNNTYTGPTSVNGGTLMLTGSGSSALTTVLTNGTLSGTATLNGSLTVNNGGAVSPGLGLGSSGTLTVTNNVTLNTGATLAFDLSGSPAGTNDQIVLGGLLTMVNPQNCRFNLVNNALGNGVYTLITGGINTSASGVGFNLNLPSGTRQTFAIQRPVSGNGQCYVQLAVTGTAGTLVWSGNNGSTWDLSTTVNWLNAGVPDIFYNLDTVAFDDSSTNGGVNISGTVSPAIVVVSNNATAYTFSNGIISGFTALVKSGPGLLTLAASNSFTGGTSISGGVVDASYPSALGTGKVTLNNGTLHLDSVSPANPVTVSGTNTLQVSSVTGNTFPNFNLTGSGRLNLTIDGNNVFTPGGDWTAFSGYVYFTGGKTLRAFSQNIGSANAIWDLGASTGGIYNRDGGYTVSLGALTGGSGTSLSGASTAGAGTTTYVVGDLNTNCTFAGAISDNAAPTALTKSGNAALTLTGDSTYTGGTTINSGTLRVDSASGSGTGSGALEAFAGAALAGNGTIGSATTIDGGAILAPGDPDGTLTISNNLTLNDSSLLQFGLGTNGDSVAVSGDLFLTGQLTVTNAGGFGPGTYILFTCGGALTFDDLVLVSAPTGYNYTIDTTAPGVVKLIVTPPAPPAFGGVNVTGSTLTLSGSNGTPFHNYYVLQSSNLTTWTSIATNQFDVNGGFTFTTNAPAGSMQNFFRLQMP